MESTVCGEKRLLRWVTWKMVFLHLGGKLKGWRVEGRLGPALVGWVKGSVALEENVGTSGELKGARRKGWNGEEGGSGRRCTSLSLLSTIRSEGAGLPCLPCVQFATVHCRAEISWYKETVPCRHVAICHSTLISSLDNDQHCIRSVTKEARTCSQIFPSLAPSRK